VAATPADQPDRARYLSGLGVALHARFTRTGSNAVRAQVPQLVLDIAAFLSIVERGEDSRHVVVVVEVVEADAKPVAQQPRANPV
jgi:hypothetical protein